MNKTSRYLIIIGLVIVFIGLFVWYKSTPGHYDKLATCMKDQGVTFYGAFWCPHCKEAKQAFGKSTRLLNYVECSTPDGQSQNETCRNARIPGYPTWEFSNAVTVPQAASEKPVLCSSEEGAAIRDCQNAADGTWYLAAAGQAFLTPAKPVAANNMWTLAPHSRAIGTTDPDTLGLLSQCTAQ